MGRLVVSKVVGAMWVFVWSCLSWVLSAGGGVALVVSAEVVMVSCVDFEVPFLLDCYSAAFVAVMFVAVFGVLVFSDFYLRGSINIDVFLLVIHLFVVFMVVFVCIPSLLGLMVGWDGLGLMSYLLVSYYNKGESVCAGLVVFLNNRVGDVMLILGVIFMTSFGGWELGYIVESDVGWVSFSMVMGGLVKSAQVPFSGWLLVAMAAPTPASALVHSSTLVTAGCYLLIRVSECFGSGLMFWLSVLSGVSVVFSGVGGLYEWDVKKLVALSTCGQMGLVLFSVSIGAVAAGFFHLLVHAVYKCLLFICVGVVIHMEGSQDLREMESFCLKEPVISSVMSVSLGALIGLPFFSSYYSKDLILSFMMSEWVSGGNAAMMSFIFGGVLLGFTYSGRLMWAVWSVKKESLSASGLRGVVSGGGLRLVCVAMGSVSCMFGLFAESVVLEFGSGVCSVWEFAKVVCFGLSVAAVLISGVAFYWSSPSYWEDFMCLLDVWPGEWSKKCGVFPHFSGAISARVGQVLSGFSRKVDVGIKGLGSLLEVSDKNFSGGGGKFAWSDIVKGVAVFFMVVLLTNLSGVN